MSDIERLEAIYDALAVAIEGEGRDGFSRSIEDLIEQLGLFVSDHSDGSDINKRAVTTNDAGSVIMDYLLVPIDDGDPTLQMFRLELMRCERRRNWEFRGETEPALL